jgi:hypothetical protein
VTRFPSQKLLDFRTWPRIIWDMQDILPEAVLDDLRDHYYAGVTEAEIGYEHNEADEDAVTGALGQALFTPGDRVVAVDGRFYHWRASHYKLGGRGPGAAEREYGADGIFQLEVIESSSWRLLSSRVPSFGEKDFFFRRRRNGGDRINGS